MASKPRKSLLLRIDPTLHEALEAWAAREFRSLNGQIEYILRDALRRVGKNVPETDSLLDAEDDRPT